MDENAFLPVLLVCFLLSFHNGVEGGHWSTSEDEDLEFEIQVKLLNKPFNKTISTEYGDSFDCVNFYDQPAFDHAQRNNYTIDYEWKPTSSDSKFDDPLNIKLKNGGCPIGTVPIRRITKEDLIRERLASKFRSLSEDNKPYVHYAVLRTEPGVNKFSGAGSHSSVRTPVVQCHQYSAARLKITNGADSIAAGWRVDPVLYGDFRAHLYIRTDAGKSHCFDAACGFVTTHPSLAVGRLVLDPTSEPGGTIRELELFIIRDETTGNWFLEFGSSHHTKIGFWPKGLFTGLANLGASAEWGGEVLSLGGPKPAMGTGIIPSAENPEHDAYFRKLSLLYEDKTIDATNLESFADSSEYQVRDKEFPEDKLYGHVMFYGGSLTLSM